MSRESVAGDRIRLSRRGAGALALLLCCTPAGCGTPPDPPPRPVPRLEFLGWDGGDLQRDNLHPHGILHTGAAPLPPGTRMTLRYRGADHPVHLLRLTDEETEDGTGIRYFFDIHQTRPPLALDREAPDALYFLLDTFPGSASDGAAGGGALAAPSLHFGVLPGPAIEEILRRAPLTFDADVIVLPVRVWNLNGAVASLDEPIARLLFDKAPETALPPSLWAHQRVDEVWAQCKIQFRLVGYHHGPALPDCWTQPIVSNQSAMGTRCTNSSTACTANSGACQDFMSCDQQQENRCTLLELAKASHEQPGYRGPEIFRTGAINVYFARQLDLYENTTLGIGCAGAYPLMVINDLWGDYSGLRVAHELGHVMGIDHHIPTTVMGDADQRTDWVDQDTCDDVRRYVEDHYFFRQGP